MFVGALMGFVGVGLGAFGAHALREECDAVLVGAGTVEADDPRLTRRLGWNRAVPHWRIVLDGPAAAILEDDRLVALGVDLPSRVRLARALSDGRRRRRGRPSGAPIRA